MATLTQDAIRSLACFKVSDARVVSLYLDVDGRRYVRPKDYEQQLDHLLRQVRDHENGSSPNDDLRLIENHVRAGFDRSRTRGVAMFSCSRGGLWEVIELPVPVRNQLIVNQSPQVKQLEAIVDSYERFGVLLADKQRARMFVFELGELVDKSELFDQLPRHDDDHGDWNKDHVRDHSAAIAHRHVKRAAEVAFSVYQERPYQHLIIGAHEEIAHELERELHSYLQERIVARLTLPVGAPDASIRDAAMAVEEEVERAKQAALVDRLRAAIGAASGGTAGLEPVLQALAERRIDTLIVSDGYEAPGWRCEGCRLLAVKGRRCPVCGAAMHQVDDVVEDAVEDAVTQSCKVSVCRDNADLDVMGRIGALLRF